MIDRKKLFEGLHTAPFVGGMSQSQVDGVNVIIDCWEATYRVQDPRFVSYSLATTYWEADRTMQPIAEYGHGRGRSYGTPTGPWHVIYYGRGDVQLTWEANYAHATKRLRELGVIDASVDLEKNPELAMRPDIAAKILVVGMMEGWFTSKKLADYFGLTGSDPVGARRIINGTDNANTIAHIYGQFFTAVNGAWGATLVPAPAKKPAPELAPTGQIPVPTHIGTAPASKTLPAPPTGPLHGTMLETIIGLILALLKGFLK